MKKKCLICGNPYNRNNRYSDLQWEKSKFCGFKCSGISHSRRMVGVKIGCHSKQWNQRISESHLAKGLSWNKNCEHCHKDFKVYNHRPEARFCTSRCRAAIVPMPKSDRTGSIPWNKGRNRQTDERILKMSLDRSGDKNWQWAGGVSRAHKYAYSTAEYKIWRKSVFERDDYTCQLCLIRGGYLEADHIKCFAHNPDLRLEVSNGRALCKPCHKTTTNYGMHKKELCL